MAPAAHFRTRVGATRITTAYLKTKPQDQYCGSRFGIRCFFTPRIRDGAMVGSGSGIRDKQTKFVISLYTKIGRIRDPGSGSGMEQWSDPDPG
jgi:hypothetical protein